MECTTFVFQPTIKIRGFGLLPKKARLIDAELI